MSDSVEQTVLDMGRRARAASHALVKLSSEQKNEILRAMADGIVARTDDILAANALDIAAGESNGLSKAMLDRLLLTPKRLESIAQAVRDVADLPDPVGEVLEERIRPNGLRMVKKRVPIGSSASSLSPGRTSRRMQPRSVSRPATPPSCVEVLRPFIRIAPSPPPCKKVEPAKVCPLTACSSFPSRIAPPWIIWQRWTSMWISSFLVEAKGLIEKVVSTARMPVIKHYDGVCHAYVHSGC